MTRVELLVVTALSAGLAGPAAADEWKPADGQPVAGVVQDQGGKPVPGARVWLVERKDNQTHFRVVEVDGRGGFRFDGVDPTSSTVVAVAKGYSFAGRNLNLYYGRP